MVPKYFFSPEIIEKRKPLSDTARRAGWVGCNIVLKQIPQEGRIFIVKNEIEIPQKEIISKVKRTDLLSETFEWEGAYEYGKEIGIEPVCSV